MSILFTSFKLGNLEIKNRFIRSATTSYWSEDDGILTDPIIEYYDKLSKGNIGLIIKGHSFVSEKGKAHEKQSGLCSEIHLPRMRELVELVHSNGSKIIAQINHGGYTSINERVTASFYERDERQARELTLEEIQQIVIDFGKTASNAIKAGFDGVQIHAAHGYLISQFLSDRVNKREDEYGGNLEKRMKLLIDVYLEIRKQIGNEAVVGMKINTDDFSPDGGLSVDDAIAVIQKMKELGLTFAELSGGGPEQDRKIRQTRGRSAEDSGFHEATWGGHAQKIRLAIPDLPLSLVAGIRTTQTMEYLLENKIVDMISMSKPFINEPDFVNLISEGQDKASCIDCFKCISRSNFAKTMLRCFHKHP
jgi:2,4-dienoyl-CoA reductase-like NADH-dependent reductase (Old Yellow Enzyme family)